jgi:hypothetical protein
MEKDGKTKSTFTQTIMDLSRIGKSSCCSGVVKLHTPKSYAAEKTAEGHNEARPRESKKKR